MKYQWVVLSVTTVGVFMASLDTRIVLIGLPTIAESLRADLETALWMTQGYQIALTIGLLLLGRVSDTFGRVKIYNLGFVVFTVGSGACVFAQTGVQLIIFRVIQGVGGAMLIANSVALITDATCSEELGFALGLNQIAHPGLSAWIDSWWSTNCYYGMARHIRYKHSHRRFRNPLGSPSPSGDRSD